MLIRLENRWRALATVAMSVALAACLPDVEILHPAELAGQWVHLRADGSWGDTITYSPDGRLLGSATRVVPQGARWRVLRTSKTGDSFCAADSLGRGCHAFRLAGDTLVFGRLGNETYLRRAQ